MRIPELPHILAIFTFARRKFEGLTRGALAKRYGLKAKDIEAVERQRRTSEETRLAMIDFNELADWEARRNQEIEGYLNAGN